MLRRWFYSWLPWSVVILPVAVFLGWLVSARGWDLFGIILFPPLTFLVLGGVTLLVRARPSVREARAVTWLDLAVIGGFHLILIALALVGAQLAWVGGLAILAAITAVWVSIVRLWRDSTRRLRGVVEHYERMAQPQPSPPAPPRGGGDDDVIVVHERRQDLAE